MDRSSGRRLGGTSVAILGAVALATTGARAQSTGGVRFREFDPALRLGFEYRNERHADDTSAIETRERTFREDLLLHTRGSVYHRRLCDFDLRAELGLEQTDTHSSGDVTERSLDGSNIAYDLRTHWFEDHPYNGTLYALRRETRARQTLFRTTEALVTEYGGEVAARDWWIPSRLALRDYDYNGRGADTNDEHRQSATLEGLRQQDGSLYQYALRHNDVDLRSGGRQFTDDEAFAAGSWQLGDDIADRLFATGRYREQNGDLDATFSQASLSADLKLSESLTSTHQLELLGSDTGSAGGRNDTWRASSALRHQLFLSLTSELGGEALRNDFSGGSIDRRGGHAEFAYGKELSFGRLNLGYRDDLFWQNEDTSLQPITVLDEAHLATLGTPIVLDNFGADPASVVVTDGTGLVLYLENVDYRLTVDRGRVSIDIALGSSIAPGQTLLVDYAFLPRPAVRFRSNSQNVRAGLRVGEWLGFELGFGEREQVLLSGIDTGTLENERVRTAAVDVGSRRGSVRAEYENRDSSFSALERVEYSASLQLPSPDAFAWFVSGNTFHTRFKEDDRVERGTMATSSLDGTIGDASHAMLRGEYRKLSLRTDEGSGWLVEGLLEHRFRKTTFDVRASYGDEHFVVASDQRHFSVWFTVTRQF